MIRPVDVDCGAAPNSTSPCEEGGGGLCSPKSRALVALYSILLRLERLAELCGVVAVGAWWVVVGGVGDVDSAGGVSGEVQRRSGAVHREIWCLQWGETNVVKLHIASGDRTSRCRGSGGDGDGGDRGDGGQAVC
jgi:hypothetical protein